MRNVEVLVSKAQSIAIAVSYELTATPPPHRRTIMTEHPLTDDRCDDIAFCYIDTSDTCDNMRASADWQLEQVIEWLRHNLGSVPLDPVGYSGHEIDVDYVIENLREDMRPRTQEDN